MLLEKVKMHEKASLTLTLGMIWIEFMGCAIDVNVKFKAVCGSISGKKGSYSHCFACFLIHRS